MRRFGDPGMWAGRNIASGRGNVPGAPTEIPASAFVLTEEAGVRHSELVPVYTSNIGGLEMVAPATSGVLYAAGRPL